MLVSSPSQLLLLPRDWRANGLGPRAMVMIDIPGLPRRPQLRAQHLLNRLQSRCGCVAGSVASLLSLIAGVTYVAMSNDRLMAIGTLRQTIVVVLVSLTLGLLVKIATLFITRVQFTRLCRVQHEILAGLDSTSG